MGILPSNGRVIAIQKLHPLDLNEISGEEAR